jgi:tetratricopeptide (TPR) repeat protein
MNMTPTIRLRMGRPVAWTAAATIVVAAVAVAGIALRPRAGAATVRLLPPPPASATAAEQRDRDIALFSERAAADPLGALDRSRLAELYLDRARSTGSFDDLSRAEEVARQSLALRGAHNTRTNQLLASILLAQHRFPEALRVARTLASENPTIATFRALLGECQLEVGDYPAADSTFAPLARTGATLATAPRIARWHEVNGRTDDARRLLLWARSQARTAFGLPAEQLAWFELRVGDLELRNGQLARADTAFRAGLAAQPGDHRVHALLARLDLMRGRPEAAIENGETAVATVLDPGTLGILADAHAAIGDTLRAADYARALESAVRGQPGSYHRAWSLWLLDHERDVERVSAKVKAELRDRSDVYGLDLYAWALHKQGRHADARRWSEKALARGTRDALLYVHAAAIDSALADPTAAAAHRTTARTINPYVK